MVEHTCDRVPCTKWPFLYFPEAVVPDYPGYKVGCEHGAKNEHDFALLVLKVRLEREQLPQEMEVALLHKLPVGL